MGHRVPGWLVLALVVIAWGTGRLLDAAGSPLGIVALVAATLSLGGFVAAAWRWPGPKVQGKSPDDGVVARLTVEGLPIVAWFVAGVAVYALEDTIFPWADPPMFKAVSGNELLAAAATIAVAGRGAQWALDLLDRRHARGRERLRREVEDAAAAQSPAAGGQPGADVAFGWHWSHVGLVLLSQAGVAAVGAWLALSQPDLAALLVGIGMCAFTGLIVSAILFQAVAWPQALLVGAEGVNVGESGIIPWSAVRSCALELGPGGPGLLVVHVHVGDAPYMTRRLRRNLRRDDPRVGVATFTLDATPAQLGAAFARFGQRLLVD